MASLGTAALGPANPSTPLAVTTDLRPGKGALLSSAVVVAPFGTAFTPKRYVNVSGAWVPIS